jgi:hypothetical protein
MRLAIEGVKRSKNRLVCRPNSKQRICTLAVLCFISNCKISWLCDSISDTGLLVCLFRRWWWVFEWERIRERRERWRRRWGEPPRKERKERTKGKNGNYLDDEVSFTLLALHGLGVIVSACSHAGRLFKVQAGHPA